MRYWTSDIVAIDTETTGLNWNEDRVFGVAIAWMDNGVIRSEYFDIRKNPARYATLRSKAGFLKKVVNHHMKFDLHMMMNDAIHFDLSRCECTMLRAALIDEHLFKYDLDSLCAMYLKKRKQGDIYQDLADRFGGKPTRHAQMRNLHLAPESIVEPYAKIDAELALELYLWQENEIKKQELQQVYDLECRLYPYVFEMERLGIRVDLDEADRRTVMLEGQIDRLQKKLNREAGFAVNPNPSGSIHQLFEPKQDKNGQWRANDGTLLAKTDAGKASINSDALDRMVHPAAKMVQRLRKSIRIKNTFIGGHIIGHAVKGRVHPNINQTKGDDTGGTGTGRLSYTDPALQQIPNRDKESAMIVRPIFLPDDNMGWSYGDLDQHELRIFHHYVNDDGIIAAYQKNPDLDGHGVVAELIGLPRDATKAGDMRNAKQMNLAMIFNMGGGELAAAMGMPYTMETFTRGGETHEYKKAGPEAQKIIDDYYRMIPGVKEISKKASSIAKTRGYVKTLMGRHIRFPNKEFSYKASGLVYQGGSADLNKDNMVRICEYLKSECPDGRLMLNIHDEYSLSMPFGGTTKHLKAIKDEIQRRPEIRVPIRIDFTEPSSNWWDATTASKVT